MIKNILIPYFNFSKSGGTRVVSQLANHWVKKGIKVEFVSLNSAEPYFPVDSRILITRIEGNNGFTKKINLIHYITRNFKKYDLILATYYITTIPIFISSLLRCDFSKNVYYIQAYEPEFEDIKKSYLLQSIAKLSYHLPFKHIVNSDMYKNYKHCKAQYVVYPGLDLQNYYHKDLCYFSDIPKIGCIGRYEKWKGIYDVCDAMTILKDRGMKFDFYIAFNDFKTIDHKFVKPDGDANLADFYRSMDIVIAPGHIQLKAVHYPVIETMACGSTVITTGYYPSNSENAYIVPIKSPEEIANAVITIINDKSQAIHKRKKALETIKQFDWDILADEFIRDFIKMK